MKTFTANYPGIDILLTDDTTRGVQQRVERNEVDFGIASIWQPSKLLRFTPLFSDNLELVSDSDHPLAASVEPIEWLSLADETFIDSGITKNLASRQSLGKSNLNVQTHHITGHAALKSRRQCAALAGRTST